MRILTLIRSHTLFGSQGPLEEDLCYSAAICSALIRLIVRCIKSSQVPIMGQPPSTKSRSNEALPQRHCPLQIVHGGYADPAMAKAPDCFRRKRTQGGGSGPASLSALPKFGVLTPTF